MGKLALADFANGAFTIGTGDVDNQFRSELPVDEPYYSASAQVSAIYARKGTHSLKFRWEDSWPLNNGLILAEIKRPNDVQLFLGNDYWIGFSIFIPDDPVLAQWIQSTRLNNSLVQFRWIGAQGTSGLSIRNGNWMFSFGALAEQNVGNVQLGTWNDFVINTRLTNDASGFVRMWRNASSESDPPVYEFLNQAVSPADLNPKFGISTGGVDTSFIEFHLDELSIWDFEGAFATVNPNPGGASGGGGGTPGDITLVGQGAPASGSGAISVPVPAGIAAGDLLEFTVVARHNDVPITPAGWTRAVATPVTSGDDDANSILAVNFSKYAGVSEPAVALADFGNLHLTQMNAWRNVNNSVAVHAVRADPLPAGTSHTLPSVNTTIDKAMIISYAAFGQDGANPSGWANGDLASIVEAVDIDTTVGADGSLGMAYGVKTAAGPVGSTTVDTSVSVEGVSISIALAPAVTATEWAATNCTVQRNAVGVSGIANTANTITATANNATVIAANPATSADGQHATRWDVRRISGSGAVELTLDGGVNWVDVTASVQAGAFGICATEDNLANPQIGIRLAVSGDVVVVGNAALVPNASAQDLAGGPPIVTVEGSATVYQEAGQEQLGAWLGYDQGTDQVTFGQLSRRYSLSEGPGESEAIDSLGDGSTDAPYSGVSASDWGG